MPSIWLCWHLKTWSDRKKIVGELREMLSNGGGSKLRLAEEEDTITGCRAGGHCLSSLMSGGKDSEFVLEDREGPMLIKILLKGGTEIVATAL